MFLAVVGLHKIEQPAANFSTNKTDPSNTDSTEKVKEEFWGIDLSHHQKVIDWQTLVKKNKPDFIILKTSEGSGIVDVKYPEYSKKSREHKILTGAYHFMSYYSDGTLQAKNFIKNAKLQKGDLYPILDCEYRRHMKPKSWIVKEIKRFCADVKKVYGVNPIIYTDMRFYNTYLKNDFKNYNFWICSLKKEPQIDYVFWQYSFTGYVHGIGPIDNNKLHKEKALKDFVISK